jgi:hypothetical protein
MRNLLGRLFKPITILLLLLFLPAIYSCGLETLTFLSWNLELGSLDFFAIGFICYFLLHGAIWYTQGQLQAHLQFIRVLRHELTHSFAAMFLGKPIDEMLIINPMINPDSISYARWLNPSYVLDWLVYLAPYYLPFFTLPLLPLRLVLSSFAGEAIDFLIGFSMAFHYVSTVYELILQGFGRKQGGDVKRIGCVFSYVIIILFNLFSLALVKAVLHQQWPDVAVHFSRFFERSGELYANIITLVLQQFRAVGLLPGS